MKVTVIGNGAIGKERIKALEAVGEEVWKILDINDTLTDEIIEQSDWIFVCTPHEAAIEIVERIGTRAKILVEKPYLGIRTDINVGFNYRFYGGVNFLLRDILRCHFGKLISVNMILSLGDAEKTWRLDPKNGRGALLDPGIHLIDLAMIISKNTLKEVCRKNWSGFWGTGIEEETHLIATDDFGVIYNIQASKVHWRNTFRLEVNGTDGYGVVGGRNRNYGNQTYRRGKRWGWKGGKSQSESEELLLDYDGEDSFIEELWAILRGNPMGYPYIIKPGTGEDNLRCIKFINNDDNHSG